MTLYFGVDIGGTSIKTAVVSETGEILHKQSFETQPERGIEDVCQQLKSVLEESLQAIGRPYSDVRGVGVGLPGFLDIENGVILELPNMGWKNIPFISIAEQTLQLPVVMENDANIAALGEAWMGAGRGASSVLCATVGTGVGGGIVLNHHLYRGVSGLAGEIGHLTVDRGGYPCNCGGHGCLETVASATAMIRHAKELQQAGSMSKDITIEGAEDVFRLAEAGDVSARQVIEEAATWLGYGLSLIAVTLNPDVIVIGGGVSKAGDMLLEPVKAAFKKYTLPLVVEAVTLKLAELGNDAGVMGAARFISQKKA